MIGNVVLGAIPTLLFDNDLTATCCKGSCNALEIVEKPVGEITIYMLISTEGSGMPTTRPKTGVAALNTTPGNSL